MSQASKCISKVVKNRGKKGKIYTPEELEVKQKNTKHDHLAEFYTQLRKVIDQIQEDNENILLMGDWNVRIGNDINRGGKNPLERNPPKKENQTSFLKQLQFTSYQLQSFLGIKVI